LGFYCHVGLDDTDSSEGMCTTFLTYKMVQLIRDRVRFLDYPNLIRHNPNIPWKTRGNASLVLRMESEIDEDSLFSLFEGTLRKFARSVHANSGLVFLRGRKVPEKLRDFGRRSLYTVLSQQEAKEILKEYRMRWVGLRSEQGIVGALAGIGNTLEGDHTFELIAYRKDTGIPRSLDKAKIKEMQKKTYPSTFNSFDGETGRVMIMPHGPDPVLCGVRGESPSSVKRAFEMLLPMKNLLGWMIFRSNQGTGEHLREEFQPEEVKAYYSVRTRGTVSSSPRIEEGGHLFFKINSDSHDSDKGLLCAAYEPTKNFRKKVMLLKQGDFVEVGGGIRKSTSKHEKVLNLEYVIPLRLELKTESRNPECPNCSSRMKSLGKEQGFGCPRCKYESTLLKKESMRIQRQIRENEIMLPPMGAHRHLTRPLQRYGVDNSTCLRNPVAEWYSFE